MWWVFFYWILLLIWFCYGHFLLSQPICTYLQTISTFSIWGLFGARFCTCFVMKDLVWYGCWCVCVLRAESREFRACSFYTWILKLFQEICEGSVQKGTWCIKQGQSLPSYHGASVSLFWPRSLALQRNSCSAVRTANISAVHTETLCSQSGIARTENLENLWLLYSLPGEKVWQSQIVDALFSLGIKRTLSSSKTLELVLLRSILGMRDSKQVCWCTEANLRMH